MCYSKAEGGKRCFYHRTKAYDKAATEVKELPEDALDSQVDRARERYEAAVASLASDDTGLVHLRWRATAIEAGDTLDGDDLAVLRKYAPPKEPSQTTVSVAEALATGVPAREDLVKHQRVPMEAVARTDGPYAVDLREALAHGKPMAPEDRVTPTIAPASAYDVGGFAAALRGDTRTPAEADRSPFAGEVTEFPHGMGEDQLRPLDLAE